MQTDHHAHLLYLRSPQDVRIMQHSLSISGIDTGFIYPAPPYRLLSGWLGHKVMGHKLAAVVGDTRCVFSNSNAAGLAATWVGWHIGIGRLATGDP